MCGITGFLDPRADRIQNHNTLAAMTRAVAHRGPNAEGLWQSSDGVANLGHRRLSIIDLSATGAQPMVARDGRHVLIFNGEIYNFQELRDALASDGETFIGTSDTEVLLLALVRWGAKSTLGKLNGMFAFAFWDNRERTLLLARDRFGEKPLYCGWQNGVFIFGSELKAIARHPLFNRIIDREALALFMRFGYIPCPWSIFRGIRKLPPGHSVTIVPEGGHVNPVPFWSLRETAAQPMRRLVDASDPDFIDELDSRFRKAVKMRMLADVPIGAFLSGGVDSSLIVALMQAQSTRPVKTFTIGFEERAYNEADDAASVARHLGTDHHAHYISNRECLDMIGRIPDLYDEPFADSSQIPTAFISQFTSRHVKVALSGDAGDELWGGYNRYLWSSRLWPKLQRVPSGLKRSIAKNILRVVPQQWEEFIERGNRLVPPRLRVRGGGDKMHKLAHSLAAKNPDEMYRNFVSQWHNPGEVLQENCEPAFLVDHFAAVPPNLDYVERMMYLDSLTYLPDDILCKVDRASMAMGLETRVPFLDNDLVDLAWSIPIEMRIHQGVSKWPLRQLLYRYLPESMFERPKLGFGVPIGDWLRGPLRDWAESMLSEEQLKQDGWFRADVVRKQWRDHLSGRFNQQHSLWTVLMFQSWLRRSWD